MGRRLKARLWVSFGAAALVVSLSAAPVLAGEITGNRNKEDYSQGRSVCKFSGQNDIPDSTDPTNPPGRVQSYGFSFVSQGLKAFVPHPGFACNPNNHFGE